MIQAEIAELIDRELTKIGEELGLYADEKLLWHSVKGISNPGGNLALHVAGNLQHFIGAVLGNSGYIRQRELEFSRKDMPLNEVKEELEKARMAVRQTLASISTDELQKNFPINVFGKEMTTEWFLLHLLSHASYHLGQINYHRRAIVV
jgi:uncharacterized damage-inducible protein DinB